MRQKTGKGEPPLETENVLERLEKSLELIQRNSIELMMRVNGWSEEEAQREWDRIYVERYLERMAEQWNQKQRK